MKFLYNIYVCLCLYVDMCVFCFQKLKLMLLKKDDSKTNSMMSHLRKINEHLGRKGTRFLTGDTMCCFDCELMPRLQHIRVAGDCIKLYLVCLAFIKLLAYFSSVARVFIYPNFIVICVPNLAEIAHLGGIFSIITSTLLGGTLLTRRVIYIPLHLRTNYSVEYPTVNSIIFHVTR
jgi:hypothetical protein